MVWNVLEVQLVEKTLMHCRSISHHTVLAWAISTFLLVPMWDWHFVSLKACSPKSGYLEETIWKKGRGKKDAGFLLETFSLCLHSWVGVSASVWLAAASRLSPSRGTEDKVNEVVLRVIGRRWDWRVRTTPASKQAEVTFSGVFICCSVSCSWQTNWLVCLQTDISRAVFLSRFSFLFGGLFRRAWAGRNVFTFTSERVILIFGSNCKLVFSYCSDTAQNE